MTWWRRLPGLTFWMSFGLSVINMIAAVVGLNPALVWMTTFSIYPVITFIVGVITIGLLILSWVNSFMSNRGGILIYLGNVLFAPFGYQVIGFPWEIGLALAVMPYPLYFGMMYVAERGENKS